MRIFEVKGKLIDRVFIKVEEITITGETNKTFTVDCSDIRMLKKASIGVITSGMFMGSFKCFCSEEDFENKKAEITKMVVDFHVHK